MFTSVHERDTGSGDQVDHRSGYENLSAICQGGDARPNVDGDPTDFVPNADDFSGVEPRPNVDSEE
jgi:hypothetical protein